ncbi:MAG TPA: S41 family peptidase [Blastocatellia bacterium]|nr:S41 family peptidase [Blastocatellia bacterium]
MLAGSFSQRPTSKPLKGFVLVLWLIALTLPALGQSLSSFDRERGRLMLRTIQSDIKKYYYDPNFRGIDLEAHFKEADDKIKDATSIGQMFGIIAQAMLAFDDSHTFFLPPQRASTTDYGLYIKMIGDRCHIMAVRPGSDAEAKGVKVGDQVLSIDGFEVTRENSWKIDYAYRVLRPKAGVRAVVQSPGGQPRQVDVMATVKKGKVIQRFEEDWGDWLREQEKDIHLSRHRYHEVGKDLFIWKMPQFDLSDGDVDEMMDKARKHKALILDLRGNGGGYETTLKRLVGNFFGQEVKIADRKGRKEIKPIIAKPRASSYFEGDLIVLVDSQSGSAAEVFARVIQLEKRGIVLGDRTAGAVMLSKRYSYESGVDIVAYYGASITEFDLIMKDGKSLEHVGVKPDELLLPSAAALAAKRDPVLSRAAALAGVTLDPAEAGALFPVEWK